MDERIVRYFDGELSIDERISLLREAEVNPALRKDLLAAQNMRGIFSLKVNAVEKVEVERQYRQFVRTCRRAKLYRIAGRAAGYAAAIALLVFATWKITLTTVPLPLGETIAVQQELYAPAGQRARITLPDGSTVWLNAGSTLRYPSVFGGERRIDLTGEAFFDVARDPGKPFIVSTASLEIMALGTQFNVYSYPDAEYASASLVDGSISVCAEGKPDVGTVLQPGQELICANGRMQLEALDKDRLLWKEGIYPFNGQTLEKIIEKLKLYYDVDIVVTNPKILRYQYTGKFRQRDGAMEILRIIQKIHHFKIYKNDESNRITLS
ncbi:MAG: FecR domain-containing protein [Tannerella sp.]|jgi:ferric-dicitrate binding protein FerR (iron transport regulator)|nr:FecR domain-containing protein [Tannerella sp.]